MATRTAADARARADELTRSGMPFQMAMAVAHGRLDLSEALERMAKHDRVERLMREHDLGRALATQIVVGHADLDQILFRRRLAAYREERGDRSLIGQPQKFTLGLHGHRVLSGVTEVQDAYEFRVVPDKGEPEIIHKLQLKYAYAQSDWKKAKKAIRVDKKAPAAEPIRRPQDRYNCSDKRLLRLVESEATVQLTLLEGEQIRGTLRWFSRYELGIEARGEVEIIVLRHALTRLRVG